MAAPTSKINTTRALSPYHSSPSCLPIFTNTTIDHAITTTSPVPNPSQIQPSQNNQTKTQSLSRLLLLPPPFPASPMLSPSPAAHQAQASTVLGSMNLHSHQFIAAAPFYRSSSAARSHLQHLRRLSESMLQTAPPPLSPSILQDGVISEGPNLSITINLRRCSSPHHACAAASRCNCSHRLQPTPAASLCTREQSP
jgi:hypothetical protein